MHLDDANQQALPEADVSRCGASGAKDIQDGRTLYCAAAGHGEEPRLVGSAHSPGAFGGIEHDGERRTVELIAGLEAAGRQPDRRRKGLELEGDALA